MVLLVMSITILLLINDIIIYNVKVDIQMNDDMYPHNVCPIALQGVYHYTGVQFSR